MKALVKYQKGPGNMEVRDIPEPVPGARQVKVKVKKAGICGSDLHIFNDDIAIAVRPPVVPGHEFSGVVTEVGEGVTEFRPGDRVVSEAVYDYCGSCLYCRTGFYNLCTNKKSLGYWYNGAFAEYTLIKESNLHHLPDDIDFLTGAMLEPLACCIHAIYDCCHIEAGDLVLISGPGAIGLMAAQTAKTAGARVVVTGTDADTERLRMAVELGSDYAVNIQRENADELIERLSGGWGADVVLECSGSEAAVRSGMKLLKKRGWYCQIGLTGRPIPFDIETICYKELHFSGSMASRYLNWEKGMQLIRQGLVKLAPLASHHFRLDDWEEAFRMFREKKGLKLIMTADGT